MKEYKGIIKDIIVNENSIDNNITFIVKIGLKLYLIIEKNTINTINLTIGEEVIVKEDIVLGLSKIYCNMTYVFPVPVA